MDFADARVEEVYASEEAEARRILHEESNKRLIERHKNRDYSGLPVGGPGVAVSQVIGYRLYESMMKMMTFEELEAAGVDSSGFRRRGDRRKLKQ